MAERGYDKFRAVLDELFMFDQADLDFGIYRIINTRREEIDRFLKNDLLPQVKQALGESSAGERAALESELEQTIAQLRQLGADPEQSAKVKELRKKLDAGADADAAENEVYNHLSTFFRRYYKEGDFISQRRYKEGVYAIPYEGEEVKLYWANHDQYYVKSAEHFRDYSFLLPDGRRVRFKLVEADTERNNNRAQAGKERRFHLAGENPAVEEDGELVIRMEYRPAENNEKQDALNAATVDAVTAHEAARPWIAALEKPSREPNGKNDAPPTVLAKHLRTYTAKNSFDYFIHKDLGGFLRRELDFYLKSEVMHLDDIDTEGTTPATVESYLAKLRAIRKVGNKIVAFLAQLEDFQKRLWLKKKFVVETSWCVTLDRVPAELYPKVAANDAQREEWVRLFAIDELKGDMATEGYSAPLTIEFLEVNPYLPVDTRFFDRDFTEALLANFEDFDEATNGLLIHSENFQALNLLQERYREQVKCVYIDPPYNTGDGDFAYKDKYRTSSWLAMMDDRLSLGVTALGNAGSMLIHIDEHEHHRLEWLVDQIAGSSNNVGPIVWDKRNPKGDATGIATQHEYLVWIMKDRTNLNSAELLQRKKENAGAMLAQAERIVSKHGGVTSGARAEFKQWLRSQPFSGGELAYKEIDDDGNVYRPVSMAWPNKRRAPDEYFIPLVHPTTGKPCPVPQRGWRNPPATMQQLLESGSILFGKDETTQPNRKYLLRENMTENVPSLFYFGGSDDDLQADMGFFFANPKPVRAAKYFLDVGLESPDTVLDFFAGSGTTAHAVINLNREDGGRRKYILVEMGEYFDTVMKPRVLKSGYSKEWKDGKPVDREGVSQVVKVLRLESYEDTLNNLRLRRGEQQASLLEGNPGLREDYLLRYWVDVETKGSESLLDVDRFADPWSYTLQVGQGSAAETRPVTVDLVETFNYLLGLRVKHVERIRGVLKVRGQLPSGEEALVVWRNTQEVPNEDLDKFLDRQRINPRDMEFDVIYVNGDNHLENSRRADETWKVRLIEEEFHRLMFEAAERGA